MASRLLLKRIVPSESALLICDMQEKFRTNIKYFPEIVKITKRLLDAAKIVDMKVLATEQYPRGLGHTIAELDLAGNNVPIFEKTKFSMCIPDLRKELGHGIKSLVVCGIEAHVCVYHTALDFLAQDFNVHIVVDASSSRSMTDRIYAYKQLEKAGANLITSECVILGLVGDSAHEKFKAVQKLILETAPDTGLLIHVSHV